MLSTRVWRAMTLPQEGSVPAEGRHSRHSRHSPATQEHAVAEHQLSKAPEGYGSDHARQYRCLEALREDRSQHGANCKVR